MEGRALKVLVALLSFLCVCKAFGERGDFPQIPTRFTNERADYPGSPRFGDPNVFAGSHRSAPPAFGQDALSEQRVFRRLQESSAAEGVDYLEPLMDEAAIERTGRRQPHSAEMGDGGYGSALGKSFNGGRKSRRGNKSVVDFESMSENDLAVFVDNAIDVLNQAIAVNDIGNYWTAATDIGRALKSRARREQRAEKYATERGRQGPEIAADMAAQGDARRLQAMGMPGMHPRGVIPGMVARAPVRLGMAGPAVRPGMMGPAARPVVGPAVRPGMMRPGMMGHVHAPPRFF